MSRKEWWRGLPLGLKLVFLFVALPAWLVVGYCMFTGRKESPAVQVAFAFFIAAALLFMAFDRRRGGGDSGFDFGDGGGD